MTLKQLLDNWASESNAANDCIIEILESYMDFVNCGRFAMLAMIDANKDDRKRIWRKFKSLAITHKGHWEPILEQAKAAKEKADCAG